jgi:hypothetical protein
MEYVRMTGTTTALTPDAVFQSWSLQTSVQNPKKLGCFKAKQKLNKS